MNRSMGNKSVSTDGWDENDMCNANGTLELCDRLSVYRNLKGNAVMMLLNYVVSTIVLTHPFSRSMADSLNRPAEWPLRSKVSRNRRFATVL